MTTEQTYKAMITPVLSVENTFEVWLYPEEGKPFVATLVNSVEEGRRILKAMGISSEQTKIDRRPYFKDFE